MDGKASRNGITRRDFLKGAGAGLATAAVASSSAATRAKDGEAADGNVVAAGTAVRGTLRVNGVPHDLEVEPNATLAEVLRGPLDLTGTKIGCDRGACGACTVLLDGQPVLSCMTLALDVGERTVTTVEGLARGGDLTDLQSAFLAHDAVQCGFCTPGMVVSCTALLDREPHPSDVQVREAISGHLCRCGTYPHIVDAVLATAKARKG